MIVVKMFGNLDKSIKMQFYFYNLNCANLCLDSIQNLDILTLVYFDKIAYQNDVLNFKNCR